MREEAGLCDSPALSLQRSMADKTTRRKMESPFCPVLPVSTDAQLHRPVEMEKQAFIDAREQTRGDALTFHLTMP